MKIRINLFCSETTVYWPHFRPWHLRPTFIQSSIVSSESHNMRMSSMRPLSAL